MNNVLKNVVDGINKLDDSDISAVIQAVKQRQTVLSVKSAGSFNPGDKVSFSGRRGSYTGTVKKVNIKYVVVDTDQGPTYKVPGSMLRKAA